MVSVHTYKNEHGICQISPLELTDVVFNFGHFVIGFPYRLLLPEGRWQNINLVCHSISQGSSPNSRATIMRTFSSSSQNGINRQDGKCSVGPTNITSVG